MQVVSSFLFASGAILQSLGVKSTFDPNATASSNQLTLKGLEHRRMMHSPKLRRVVTNAFDQASLQGVEC